MDSEPNLRLISRVGCQILSCQWSTIRGIHTSPAPLHMRLGKAPLYNLQSQPKHPLLLAEHTAVQPIHTIGTGDDFLPRIVYMLDEGYGKLIEGFNPLSRTAPRLK